MAANTKRGPSRIYFRPTLVHYFVNDLHFCTTETNNTYAHDNQLYFSHECPETIETIINDDLDRSLVWFSCKQCPQLREENRSNRQTFQKKRTSKHLYSTLGQLSKGQKQIIQDIWNLKATVKLNETVLDKISNQFKTLNDSFEELKGELRWHEV